MKAGVHGHTRLVPSAYGTANTDMHGDPAVTADWMQCFERKPDATAAPVRPTPNIRPRGGL